MKAKARPHTDDPYKTGIERRWAAVLEEMYQNKEIVRWRYEPFNLRLSDGIFYRIDFMVVRHDGEIELHEVKGYHRDMRAAKMRFKLAKNEFPEFHFVWVTRRKKEWIEDR